MSKIKAPIWLSAEAKKIFKDVVGYDTENTMFEQSDTILISLLADAITEYINCLKEIQDSSTMIISTGNGHNKEMEKPEVMMKERATKNILTIVTKLGLSPEARAKMKIETTKAEADDIFSTMFKEQANKMMAETKKK